MSANAFCHCHPPPSSAAAPPNYRQMVALSAVLNPETVALNTFAVNDKRAEKLETEPKVILFQSLYNGTVGFDQVQFAPQHGKLHVQDKDKGEVVGFYGEKGVPTLKFGSTLTSVVVNNIVHTYAVFAAESKVWLVSPIYMPIEGAFSEYGNIASTISPKTGRASLFWQDGDSNEIVDHDPSTSTGNIQHIPETANAKPNTSIAAINDGTTRYLVYQTSTKKQVGKKTTEGCTIVVRNLDAMESETAPIPGSTQVIDTVAVQIAAVYTTSEKGDRIFVYHTDKDGTVYRSHSAVGPGLALKFSKTEPLTPGLVIDDNCNLSVLAGSGKNIIYTAESAKAGPQITHIKDKWD